MDIARRLSKYAISIDFPFKFPLMYAFVLALFSYFLNGSFTLTYVNNFVFFETSINRLMDFFSIFNTVKWASASYNIEFVLPTLFYVKVNLNRMYRLLTFSNQQTFFFLRFIYILNSYDCISFNLNTYSEWIKNYFLNC